jgi:hypothetical protein
MSIDWDALTDSLPRVPAKSATTLVPFGKYKGQPIEAMAHDRSYCDWLTAQPWFREKHPNVYTLVINNFAEPSETPEHNQMQVRFLDETWRKKLALLIYPALANTVDAILKDTRQPDPETHCLVPTGKGYMVWARELHGWRRCGDWERLGPLDGATTAFSADGNARFEEDGIDVVFHAERVSGLLEAINGGQFSCTLNVEIKPQLGDDFPAVLRQIKRLQTYERTETLRNDSGNGYHTHRRTVTRAGAWVLLVRSYAGSVSYEQVAQFFASAHIRLLRESDVETVTLPEVLAIDAQAVAERTGLTIRSEADLEPKAS